MTKPTPATTTPTPAIAALQLEIKAMRAIARALDALPPESRERVLQHFSAATP